MARWTHLGCGTDSFCVFSVYEQIYSAYFQYMNRSFCVFNKYLQWNSIWRSNLFRVFLFSGYVQIHSAHSKYMNRLIPRILNTHTDSFRVFGICAQIILNIRNGIIFFSVFKGTLHQKTVCSDVCNWTKNPQGIINYLTLIWHKKCSAYLDNMRNDLQIKILANLNLNSKIM